MDIKYIFGKHTTDMPGFNTVRTLEKRKFYILQKLQVKIEEKSFLLKELRALEKVINFIKWILNNTADNNVRETIEKYYNANGNKYDGEEIADEDILKGKGL